MAAKSTKKAIKTRDLPAKDVKGGKSLIVC